MLTVGDRLAIGPVEFEVVAARQTEPHVERADAMAGDGERSLEAAQAELAALHGEIGKARAELASLGEQFASRRHAAGQPLRSEGEAEGQHDQRKTEQASRATEAKRQAEPNANTSSGSKRE